MTKIRVAVLSATLGVAFVTGSTNVAAQDQAAQDRAPTTVLASPGGTRYEAGPLWRALFGRHYREVWGDSIRVDVLDLGVEAGGLTPTRTGGGLQTRSLRFDGADGQEYRFRSIDKTPVLDSLLNDTFVADLVQDEISATFPYGSLVASPLMMAAGVLHARPRLVVLPDDPRLGAFREEFAGMLGVMEVHPNEGAVGESFSGARLVVSSERLVERITEGPADRVSPDAFLRARLMDFLLGDWDRHRDQWRWATYDDGETRFWEPIARDRDQVFYRYDGVALRLLSLYRPRFVRFDSDYPSVDRLHWQSRDIDYWFLAELERGDFDRVAHELQEALTNDVIDGAVRQLPSEVYERDGERLTRLLEARRDKLDRISADFYELLAMTVDVRATDAPDHARVVWMEDGHLRVELSGSSDSAPYWARTFSPEETGEVRIHLGAGDDRVLLSGAGDSPIDVKIVGGEGADVVQREAGLGSPQVGKPRIYDEEGVEVVGAAGLDVSRKAFDAWEWSEEDRVAPRDRGDWTYPVFWSSVTPELGLFIGGGVRLRDYGFRKRPFASEWDLRGGYAPVRGKWRAQAEGRFHRENSGVYLSTGVRVSRLDVAHYYGLGNATPSGGTSFHQVDLTSAVARLGVGVETAGGVDVLVGLRARRSTTRENADRFFGTLGEVYGSGTVWQWDIEGRASIDPLEGAATPHRVRVEVDGHLSPAVGDLTSPMGSFGGAVSALLATPSGRISFAPRIGGKQVLGNFPWYEAAFVGGQETLRGWNANRFAGDRALWGSGELRIQLARPVVVVPSRLGIYGFSDVGRVFVEGASPDGWHLGFGGGLYLQPLGQPYLVRVGLGRGSERTTFSATLGLPY